MQVTFCYTCAYMGIALMLTPEEGEQHKALGHVTRYATISLLNDPECTRAERESERTLAEEAGE